MTYQHGIADSDSENLGSNPSPPAINKRRDFLLVATFPASRTNRTSGNGQRTADARKPAQSRRGKNRVSPRPAEARARYVYILERADGCIKIGVSRNAKRRRAGLQGASPEKLILAHTEKPAVLTAFQVEVAAMQLLDRWRVSGEWFRCKVAVGKIAIAAAQAADSRGKDFLEFYAHVRDLEADWERLSRLAVDRRRGRDIVAKAKAAEAAEFAWGKVTTAHDQMSERFPDLWGEVSEYFAWRLQNALDTHAAAKRTRRRAAP